MLRLGFVGLIIVLGTVFITTDRANAERFTMRPLAMPMAPDSALEFDIDTSVFCADCHQSKFTLGGAHAPTMGSSTHKVGIVYAAQNMNLKYLKSRPDANLDNGKVVCTTCHEGYTEHLLTDKRHDLSDSRGTLDCSSCHDL